LDNGFNEDQINVLGNSGNNSQDWGGHKWIEILLNNRIIVADATESNYSGNANDLYNAKSGEKMVGFVEFYESEFRDIESAKMRLSQYTKPGPDFVERVKQLQAKNNGYAEFDSLIGYASDQKYVNELVKEAELVFGGNNDNNNIDIIDFVANQKLDKYDGFEAYRYFEAIEKESSASASYEKEIINNRPVFTAVLEDSKTGKKITYNNIEGLLIFN
jgi:hypothetical protein